MNNEEIKTLRHTITFSGHSEKYRNRALHVLGILWFVCAGVFAILVHYTSVGSIDNIWAFLICSIIGAAIGFFWAYYSSASQWKYVVRYIDIESMKKRLAELET